MNGDFEHISSASTARNVKPRAKLIPKRNPNLQAELNNDRIYKVLRYLWTTNIVENGPAEEALIGTAIFDVPYRLFEIYHVFPAAHKGWVATLKNVLAAVADVFENGTDRVLISPGLIVALEPSSGEMIWSGVASQLSIEVYEQYVRHILASHVGQHALSVGWIGY